MEQQTFRSSQEEHEADENIIQTLSYTKRGMRRITFEACVLLCASFATSVFMSLQWIIAEKYVHQRSRLPTKPSEAPFIAIVCCIKSFGYDPAFSLERILIPSIHQTLTAHEREAFRVELILGYDEDDAFWQDRANQLDAVHNGNHQAEDPIPVSFLSIRKKAGRENLIPFNELCQAAYDYGATYIVRVNDDTQFISPRWATLAIRTLQQYSPPNVGVVGPTCHEGNTKILTHDMVHAPSHLQIFDTYYPTVFDNYYVDDWISRVYGNERTKMMEDWVVIHHLHMYGTRYKPSFSQDNYLNDTIKEGQAAIQHFLLSKLTIDDLRIQKQKCYEKKHLVLGKDILARVDGPMAGLHLSLIANNTIESQHSCNSLHRK